CCFTLPERLADGVYPSPWRTPTLEGLVPFYLRFEDVEILLNSSIVDRLGCLPRGLQCEPNRLAN
ncbi:MAG: hypothetical protein ACREP5_15885, partial [Candidatus Binatia bacterium]